MKAPVSVIIPTYKRVNALSKTLNVVRTFDPQPSEIIVHVDAGDSETAPWLSKSAPDVHVLESAERVGPGGGRNRLMDAASEPYVVSLDDDSYPLDRDYLQRIVTSFKRNPEAGVLSAVVWHRGEEPEPSRDMIGEVSDFMGCGCAYRMSAWDATSGYLPRPVPYGMEETDLVLQLLDAEWTVLQDYRLRILHDTTLAHHDDPFRTAGSIANAALLPYVRYPVQYLPWGVAQYVNKIVWTARAGRANGIPDGLWHTVREIWRYRSHRDPVSVHAVRRYRMLRAKPIQS